MGATRAGASEFRTCQSPVASNVMSKPKVLDAQSQGIVQLPDISTIGDIPGRTMLAHLRAEVADEQREGSAHAIVYRAKTNPTGPFKNDRRLVAT